MVESSVQTEGTPEAAPSEAPRSPNELGSTQLSELRALFSALEEREVRIERLLVGQAEELRRLRRAVRELEKTAATRKQLKKLKKALDQLEVIELAEDAQSRDR